MAQVGGTVGVEVTPADHALDQLRTGLDHLIKVVEDGGLDHYPNVRFVGFMQDFERVRNRLARVDTGSSGTVSTGSCRRSSTRGRCSGC